MESVLRDVSADDLRGFIRDVLAAHPDLRNRFLARFGDEGNSIQEYRADIEQLFDQHTQDYPVVTDAIDFSRFFDLAKQYCEHERYQEAAIVYRALFEGIDDNQTRIDAAYDHYAKALRSALEGYVDCVLAADPDQDEFEKYTGVLKEQATSEHPANSEQFYCVIDDLEERRWRSSTPPGKRFAHSVPNSSSSGKSTTGIRGGFGS